MVATYKIFGRQVGAHYLSMATLGTFFTGSWLATRSTQKSTAQGPPINASSKDEEAFIEEFLRNIQAEEKKEKT